MTSVVWSEQSTVRVAVEFFHEWKVELASEKPKVRQVKLYQRNNRKIDICNFWVTTMCFGALSGVFT
ncbi:hypothetical protein B9Z55_014562 [Caenorhabditis nigoni]|uniref:Uncharacterized protein n=1 Tax=Caenorhabditis nigoni TaxID=1611254 RepID=A0A2G5U6E4_9PELO|nr:hypothetical protein B9Z55_014562 [Caenorhabditis nigoni]